MIHPSWSYSAVIYELNFRQLTPSGTFAEAEQRLPFLRSIGIDILWLMPIYPIGMVERKGSLGSYYSISDYCGINDEFGTLSDFQSFLTKAQELGFKVILDWVANHTARDAKWLSEKSADWYERDDAGEALVPWDWSDTAKLNYANHEVWQGQIDSMKYWLEIGVDGFRCDMAMLVPIAFWEECARELHKVKSDVYMLAEAEESNLFNGAFDACYAWEMHHLMCDVAKGTQRVNVLRDHLYRTQQGCDYPAWAIKMAFTSNHDENSWQGTEQMRFGAALDVMTLFSFVAPATMPLIYTGQEVGYDHSFEFFDRDPIPAELYKECDATAYYRRLAEVKHSMLCLRAGEMGGVWSTINTNADDCLLILVRECGDDRVVAIMNLSPYTVTAQYNVGIYAGEYDLVFDTIAQSKGAKFTLNTHNNELMSPWSYRLLTMKK